VNDTVYGCIGSNSQTEPSEGCQTENRVAPKATQCISHILAERIDPPTRPLLIALFARALDGAILYPGMPACFYGTESCGNFYRDRLLKMKSQLFVEFIASLAKDQKSEPGQKFSDHAVTSPARPRTRPTALESRSHVSSFASIVFSPQQ
jgi:hypothetical protein